MFVILSKTDESNLKSPIGSWILDEAPTFGMVRFCDSEAKG